MSPDRSSVFERSSGHCWLCGLALRNGVRLKRGEDVRDQFCVIEIDGQALPACRSCGASIPRYRTLCDYRWLKMRQQLGHPILSDDRFRALAKRAAKARVRYHTFWFETPEGQQVIATAPRE